MAVENGVREPMPGLSKMTKRQMSEMLQSLWTFCDESEVPRLNDGRIELDLHGRTYSGFGWPRKIND